MRLLFTIGILFIGVIGMAQTSISPEQLLNKAINFHDPQGKWTTFQDSLQVVMTTPNAAKRTSHIYIDLPQEFFSVKAKRDTTTTYYEISKGICKMRYNHKEVDDAAAQEKGMSCDRAELYKNYYTYLYGLPMKLKDPGTNINYPVETKSFQEKDYLVLKATYDANVGSDIWYFYFDPNSFAMEVYQFYKTDDSGNLIPESGEYIVLEELATIDSIKMPKIRNWYYNKDNKFLGTDTLIEN